MKQILLIVLLLLNAAMAAPEPSKPEKVSIQLNWLYQFEFAGFIAAKEKGFYKEAGLDVELREYRPGLNVANEVVEGKATFGVYHDDITFLADRKLPVIWLQNYLKRPALALAVKPNIFTPKDLVGKRIMTGTDQLRTSGIGLMLKSFGIDDRFYTQVPHSFTIEPFIEDKVDAMTVYLSNELFELQKNKVNYNLLDPTAYNINSLSMNLFTSKSTMKRSENTVKRLMAATEKGWRYALNNKNELIDIIHKRYSPRKSVEALRYEADVIDRLIMADFYPIGSLPYKQIYQNANSLRQSGLLKNSVVPDTYLYSDKSAGNAELSDNELAYLAEKGMIRVCIDPDWMPFEKLEAGKHLGMTSDYMGILSDRIGLPFEIVDVKSWKASVEKAKARQCDIYSLAMETPERKTYMDFTTPYIRMPLVLATTTDKLFISDVAILNGKRIGVVKGYAFAEILRNRYPGIDLVEVINLREGLQKTINGDLYGMADSLAPTGYQIQHFFPGELKITGKFDETFELGIGTRNDEPLLHDIFEKVIATLGQEEHQEILNRWISISYQEQTDYRLVWQILGIAAAVALLLSYIIARQKRQNRILEEARTRINETLDSFKALFNSTLEAIILTQNGKVIEANESMTRLFGFEKEEVIGMSPVDFVADEYKGLLISKMNEPSVDAYEMDVFHKNGERMHVLVRGEDAVFQGEKVRISAIVDISRQKVQQQSLEAINLKLQEMATHDQLTGLGNRRMLEDSAAKEIERHIRYNHPLSMLIVDVDFFKQVNDQHGHLVGDYVLKELTRIMAKESRTEDVVGRWGGEEFLFILPETGIEEAYNFGERLRKKVEEYRFKTVGRITLSGGVAEFNSNKGMHEWFTEADDCLYFAKEHGRNRIVKPS
jgi:diguanylate cyclase (GGDEF)-like protein/PAS domain S-box-containing protein